MPGDLPSKNRTPHIIGRCWGCWIPMLPEDAENDARVQRGTHSTLERTYPTGERFCYGCVHYPEG